MRMFQQISELIADEDAFVCVLIGELIHVVRTEPKTFVSLS